MAPLSSPYFLGIITDVSAAPAYSFVEAWQLPGSPTPGPKVAGRFGNNVTAPGYAVDGSTFAVNDLVQVRSADGNGGLSWELSPISSGGGGSLASGESSYTAVVNITPDDTWVDTGFTLSLPAAGTYLILFRTNGNAGQSAKTASNAFVYVSIYNATAAAFLSDSVEVCVEAEVSDPSQAYSRSVTVQRVITVTAPSVLHLYGRRNSGVTWTNAAIGGSNSVPQLGLVAAWTVLSWVQLA